MSILSVVIIAVNFFNLKDRVLKKQSEYIFIGIAIPVIFGTITEGFFYDVIPEFTNFAFLLGCLFIGYAIYKYRAFDLNPEAAVNNILETMGDGFIMMDSRNNIISVNRATREMLRMNEAEILGRNLRTIMPHEADKIYSFNPLYFLERSDVKYIETSFIAKDEQEIPVSLAFSALKDKKSGVVLGKVCIARDITERKEKDNELRRHKERLEELVVERTVKLNAINERYVSLFRNSPVPLVVADLSGVKKMLVQAKRDKITDIVAYCRQNTRYSIRLLKRLSIKHCNRAALNMFEASGSNEFRYNFMRIFKQQSFAFLLEVLGELYKGKRLIRHEGIVYTLKNNIRYVYLQLSPTPQSRYSLKSVLLSTVNITSLKEAEKEKLSLEEQLQHSQKMEALGNLAGGIAHDFNNLLTAILGYSNMIKLELSTHHEYYRGIEIIESAAKRAADLIKQLLGFARKGKMQSVPVHIHVMVNEVIAILKRTFDKRIKIIRKMDAEYPVILGDPTQIEQVILNLAVNARDAMDGKGQLTFETENINLTREDLEKYPELQPGLFLRVRATDTGMGISTEIIDRIFEPFFTTKENGKGTGMGLAVAYGIVRNHEGFMDVSSPPSGGTVFSVYLPAAKSVPIPRENKVVEIPIKGRGRILVIDDEEIVCNVVQKMLKTLEYSCSIMMDSVEAVEYYAHHFKKYDLIIIDMSMPGLNGRDCFLALKRINPQAKVVLSTGHAQEGDIQKILDEGILAFIQKPFRISDLADVLHKVLISK